MREGRTGIERSAAKWARGGEGRRHGRPTEGIRHTSITVFSPLHKHSFVCAVRSFHVCEGSQSLIVVSDGLRSTFKTLAFHLHTKPFSVVGTVVPHMKVVGLIPRPGPLFCGVCVSLCVCVGSLQVLHLPPTVQRRTIGP